MTSKNVKQLERELCDALEGGRAPVAAACLVRHLARAVAREEIERAKVSDNPTTVAPPTDTRTTPGGVRVVWTDTGHETKFTQFVRIEVDREALIAVLALWANDGDMTLGEVAARLGLTLSDRGET